MPVQRYDVRRPLSDGGEFEKRYWSPLNTPVLDEKGYVRYIIHRVENVTNFVQTTADESLHVRATELEFEVDIRSREIAATTALLEQSNAELETFNYTVSHDLRAPLRAMWGYANALEEDFGSRLDAGGLTYIAQIAQAADTMDRLIIALLNYSRLSRSAISLAAVDVTECCYEALREIETGGLRHDWAEIQHRALDDFLVKSPSSIGRLPSVVRSVMELADQKKATRDVQNLMLVGRLANEVRMRFISLWIPWAMCSICCR